MAKNKNNDKRIRELISEYKAGNDLAMNEIIELTRGFCMSYVVKRIGGSIYDRDDLMQEAFLGIHRAVEKFDETKDNGFLTYARFWINHFVDTYCIKNNFAYNPNVNKQKRKKTKEEKEKALDIDYNPGGRASIDCLDYVMDDSQYSAPNSSIEEMMQMEAVRSIALSISDEIDGRQLYILENRVLSEEPKTLKEIANNFSLSIERVRQLEEGLYEKLKEEFSDKIGEFY